MELSQDHIVAILGILLAVSELIALNPKFKSNSILQLVNNSIKKLLNKKDESPQKKIEKLAEELIIDEVIDIIEDEIDKHKK